MSRRPKLPTFSLPVTPPLEPMLAKRTAKLPRGDDWLFEPKWDGFRCLLFREGEEVLLQSRDKKPLGRYFPELPEPLRAQLPERCVLDGELVIARHGALDFEALQMRIHPAKSRVDKLAEELPASLVVWDLLALGDESLLERPFRERRAKLEGVLAEARSPLFLTPITTDKAVAADWFERFEGAGFDGVMAKKPDGPYEPKKRVMLKVKHERTADCVVAGFRWHKNSDPEAPGGGDLVGSLLLALYGDDGRLHHIGVAASFTEKRRRELVEELAPWREGVDEHPWRDWAEASAHEDGQRRPGSQSRWSQGRDLSFVPLRPERVAEVKFDHLQGRRLRHTAHFKRWRVDKAPAECTYEQVVVAPPAELGEIFT